VCGRVSESRGELSVVFLRTMIRGECRGLIARVVGKSLEGVAGVFDSDNVKFLCCMVSVKSEC
jgi:hypothetical protein